MATNDDAVGRDHYEDVAIVFCGYQCEKCGDYCSGEPTGAESNLDTPWHIMAQTARQLGWSVEPHADNWRVLCPKCKPLLYQ